jgi:NADH-quinone oxidoreductase subunit J
MGHSQQIFYAALSVLALLALGWGLGEAGANGLAFGFFTTLTLGGAVVCIWERSVVRSAFALLATFTGTAGFFLLLGADFLAMAQILIYVGGILALLLFGVMLSPPDIHERKLSRIGAATLFLGGGVAYVAVKAAGTFGTWAVMPADELPAMESHAREIGLAFMRDDQYVVAFELAAFLLTVALVAAVYIARRKASDFEPEGGA